MKGPAPAVLALALLTTAPSRAADGPVCLRVLAQACIEHSDGNEGVGVQRLAECHELVEGRFLLCLVAAQSGPLPELRRCIDRLRGSAWAGEALLAAGQRALADADPRKASAYFEQALAASPDLARARAGMIALAGPQAARSLALELARNPGRLRFSGEMNVRPSIRPVARALHAAIQRVDPGCGACQGKLAYLHYRMAESMPGPVKAHDWRAAAASLRVVVDRNPRDFDSRLSLGDTLNVLGDHEGAVALYAAGLALKPDWVEGLLEQAQSLINLKRPEKAIPLLEKVTTLDASNAVAWARLGRSRRMLGRADALDALRRAAAGGSPSPETLVDLGQSLLESGDLVGARDAFRQAMHADSNLVAAHYGLARALRGLGDGSAANQALVAYSLAIETQQRETRAAEKTGAWGRSVVAALAAVRAGKLEDARAALGRGTATNRDFDLAPLARAAIAVRDGRDPGKDLDAIVALVRAANPKITGPK